jgi:hypothetical protein
LPFVLLLPLVLLLLSLLFSEYFCVELTLLTVLFVLLMDSTYYKWRKWVESMFLSFSQSLLQ